MSTGMDYIHCRACQEVHLAPPNPLVCKGWSYFPTFVNASPSSPNCFAIANPRGLVQIDSLRRSDAGFLETQAGQRLFCIQRVYAAAQETSQSTPARYCDLKVSDEGVTYYTQETVMKQFWVRNNGRRYFKERRTVEFRPFATGYLVCVLFRHDNPPAESPPHGGYTPQNRSEHSSWEVSSARASEDPLPTPGPEGNPSQRPSPEPTSYRHNPYPPLDQVLGTLTATEESAECRPE